MNAKKTLTVVCGAVFPIFASSSGAFAATSETSKIFVSGPLILLFLGFCALVVVMQCIPAIIMLYGMIKGFASKKEDVVATAKQN
jgi:hypothetical protein